LIAALGTLLLTGCSDPQLLGIHSEQTLSLANRTTLDAAGSGQAAYFCRRVICAGDDSDNNAVRGLMEFDLAGIPAGQGSQLVSATLRLYQGESSRTYAALQNLVIEQIQVANLQDATAFNAPALDVLTSEVPGEGFLEIDVSKALKRTLALGGAVVQFRLRFSRPSNNDNLSNLALFSTADEYAPQLILRFAKP